MTKNTQPQPVLEHRPINIAAIPIAHCYANAENRGGILSDDDASIRELAASIAELGQLEPILVRPVKGQGGSTYEILAGERRWRACRVAGLNHVLAQTHDVDDETAFAIRLVENLQREDLDPLTEAETIAHALRAGWSPERIAQRSGRTLVWVHRRAQLSDLRPQWVKAWRAQQLRGWGVGHLELIARLPCDEQDRLSKEMCVDELTSGGSAWLWDFDDQTVSDLAQLLEREVLHRLDKAPWDLADESLPGGPCTSCAKRSACQQHLFDQPEDRCLDSVCWGKKHTEIVERKRLAALEQHGEQLVVAQTNRIGGCEKGVMMAHDFEPAKKSDPKALPVFLRDGPQAGKVLWRKPRSWAEQKAKQSAGAAAAGAGDPVAEAKRKLKDGQERLAKRRRTWQIESAVLEIESGALLTRPEPVVLVGLIAMHGTSDRLREWDAIGKRGVDQLVKNLADPEKTYQYLWESLRIVWAKNLSSRCKMDAKPAVLADAIQVLEWGGATQLAAELADHAERELPEPKSWAKLRQTIADAKVQAQAPAKKKGAAKKAAPAKKKTATKKVTVTKKKPAAKKTKASGKAKPVHPKSVEG